MKLPKGWTQAKFNAFVKNGLRSLTLKWPPKHEVKKKARVKRGWYHCAMCGQEVSASTFMEKKGKKKRVSNVFVDHINPVVDPNVGFIDWNTYIERMFCIEEGLQLLCRECHDIKTKEEKAIARGRTKL